MERLSQVNQEQLTTVNESEHLVSDDVLSRWQELKLQRSEQSQRAEQEKMARTVTTASLEDGTQEDNLSVDEQLTQNHVRKLAGLVDQEMTLDQRAALHVRLAKCFDQIGTNLRLLLWGQKQEQWKKLAEYVIKQPDLVAKIADDTLVDFCLDKFMDNSLLTAQLEERIAAGAVLLDQAPHRVEMFGRVMDPARLFAARLSPELLAQLRENWRRSDQDLPENLKVGDQNGDDICRQSALLLAEVVRAGQFGKRAQTAYQKLRENYPDAFHTFDFRVIREDLLTLFPEKYLLEIGVTDDLSSKLVSLHEKAPELVLRLSRMVKTWQQNFGGNDFYRRSVAMIDFLWQNSDELRRVGEKVNDETLRQYVMFYAENHDNVKLQLDLSNDFASELAAKVDKNCLTMETQRQKTEDDYTSQRALERYQELYYQKFFMMDKAQVEELLQQCHEHWDEVEAWETSEQQMRLHVALKLLAQMQARQIPDWTMISEQYPELDFEASQQKLRQLQNETAAWILEKMRTQTFRLTSDEMLQLREAGRQLYVETYVRAFAQTQERIKRDVREEDFRGKKIKVAKLDGDFSLLVHSNNTGFTQEKNLKDQNYVQAWQKVDALKTHGLSTSFIDQENVGTAPVSGDGVLYGFTNLQGNEIFSFAPYDLNSHIANYGFSTGNRQTFVSREQMSQNSLRVYNEFVLAREQVKPSCVIVTDEMDEMSRDNAYTAAAQWEIPVVELATKKLVVEQTKKIISELTVFRQTGQLEHLVSAVRRFEASTAGWHQNTVAGTGREGILGQAVTNQEDIEQAREQLQVTLQEVTAQLAAPQARKWLADELQEIQSVYERANAFGISSALPETSSLLHLTEVIARLRETS